MVQKALGALRVIARPPIEPNQRAPLQLGMQQVPQLPPHWPSAEPGLELVVLGNRFVSVPSEPYSVLPVAGGGTGGSIGRIDESGLATGSGTLATRLGPKSDETSGPAAAERYPEGGTARASGIGSSEGEP